jgi:undecaprenyl-diphosphatase
VRALRPRVFKPVPLCDAWRSMTSLWARVRNRLPQEDRILFAVLGVTLALWVFLGIASLMATGRTQAFDERVLSMLRRPDAPAVPIGPAWCKVAAIELTALGSVVVLLTFIVAVVGYLALERRLAMLALVVGATFSGMVLSSLLKALFGRPRPTVVPPLVEVHSASFPSGHSMLSAVVYLTLGALLARTTTRRRLRVYFIAVALGLTFVVGLSRVYLGVHYPTDVVGGWAAGALWALLCALGAQRLQRRNVVDKPS